MFFCSVVHVEGLYLQNFVVDVYRFISSLWLCLTVTFTRSRSSGFVCQCLV